jgi:hypothetical protein
MSRGFDHFMVAVRLGRTRKLRRNFTVPERWCYVAGVLTIAAKAPIRGRLLIEGAPADAKDVAEEAGVSVAVAARTLDKCRTLGMLMPDEELACERVHDWDQHNPEPKKDQTAAERAKRYRDNLKRKLAEEHRHGTVTRDVTDRHGPEVEGEGKVREEPPSPPVDAGDSAAGQLLEILNRQERFRPVTAAMYEVGLKSLADAHPDKNLVAACHEAVAVASDPAWRMTNPLRVVSYCLRRQEVGQKPPGTTGQNVVRLSRTCARCKLREVVPGYGAYCEPCSEAIAG